MPGISGESRLSKRQLDSLLGGTKVGGDVYLLGSEDSLRSDHVHAAVNMPCNAPTAVWLRRAVKTFRSYRAGAELIPRRSPLLKLRA